MRRTLYWARVGLINLALCALILGGGEICTRATGLAPDVISINPGAKEGLIRHSPNPLLGYLFVPNFSTPVPAYDGSYFRTNSVGLRDRERRISKPEGYRRVIVLGDSVVSAIHTGVDFTIARQLEKMQLAKGRKVEAINMGVLGYCTRAEVELLETIGLQYDPDLVVLVFVENDYRDFNEDMERAFEYDRPETVNGLFKASELFRFFALSTDFYYFRTELMPEYRENVNRQAVGENNVPRGLARLAELAREHEFQVLIALWPDFRDDGIFDNDKAPPELRARLGDESDSQIARDTLTIERLAARHDFPVMRLSPAFRRDFADAHGSGAAASPREHYTNGDGMHPVRTGTFVAAEALLPEVDRLLAD